MNISKVLSIGRLGLAALMAAGLAGCGGGGGGGEAAAPPTPPPSGTPVVTAAAANPAGTNTAANPNQAFALVQGSGASVVTVNSPPVVKFAVIDSTGKPVTGLYLGGEAAAQTPGANLTNCGTTVSGTTISYARNARVTIAKLIPGGVNAAGVNIPDQWQNLIYSTSTSAGNGGSAASPLVRPATDPIPSPANNAPKSTLSYDATTGVYTYQFSTDVTDPNYNTGPIKVDGSANPGQWTSTLSSTGATQAAAPATGGALTNGRVLAKDGTTTYRVAVQLCYVDNGIQVYANPTYDFTVGADGKSVPVTDPSKTRKVVDKASCNECHNPITAHGSRVEPDYCVMCHNSSNQDKSPSPTAGAPANTNLDFRLMVHKIHMGSHLMNGFKVGTSDFSDVGFPQDVRNCTKCHDGSTNAAHKTAQGDNWKNVPSAAACGACHDGINFATGSGTTLNGVYPGHIGGAQADDSKCGLCHNAANIPVYHIPVTPPTAGNSFDVTGGNANSNAASIASNTKNLPAGAIIVSYDVNSVSVVSGRPTMRFRMLQNGTATPFNAPGGELWPNFIGSPSAYFVWSVPQDGIAAPADFNASASCYIKNGWNGTATSGTGACTVVADGTTGYYIATITGVTVPANANMVTGGVGFTYSLTSTQPLTQTNVPGYLMRACGVAANGNKCGGLIVAADTVQKVASGYTGRRAIVDNAKCNLCHEQLGEFTDESFHAGQRNDGTTCAWCHKPNQTSSGWAADSSNFIHAIHAGVKSGATDHTTARTVQFTWHAVDSADNFSTIGFPGNLKKCETCHLPGTYDFSATASLSAVPNRLYRTVATGKFNSVMGSTTPISYSYSYSSSTGACTAVTTAQTVSGAASVSPYVTSVTVNPSAYYGVGFINNPGATTANSCDANGNVIAVAAGATRDADGATLVISPIATACFSCHDGNMVKQPGTTVKDHIEQMGLGSIYKDRTTALGRSEQCLLCHGSTSTIAPIKAMHGL